MIKSTYVKSKKRYKVSFELPQDHVGESRDVRVLGNFNEWSWENGLQLKVSKSSYTASTELPAGNYEFRYLVDGHHWANDDSADSYSDSGHGSTNCCFSLKEVKEEPKTKKSAAKNKTDDKIEAADSAPASKPVVTPAEEKRKSSGLQKEAEKKAAAKKSSTKKTTAKKSSTKKSENKDDLKKIEGIGPKIAGLLNDAGINTFADLSKASEKQLADVLQEAGARFRLAKHDTWQEQAKLAADGKMDELKKMQEELKGGKR
jgi:predicted flap endonuclease-1-like 5' DNA nuclease